MTAVDTPDLSVSQQGHYAGVVTRLVALIIDQTTASLVLAIAFVLTEGAIDVVVEGEYQLELPPWLAASVSAVWFFIYYAYSWAASGKTFGSALLGLRVVATDGSPIGPRRAAIRTLALPLSLLTFGLGFLLALVQRQRKALQDVIAGTVVVYDWDARSARLRFLAAQRDQATTAGVGAATTATVESARGD
ncbi:MAG TPA: RDD family protein [Microthrixaceae bacterium]|nr:RDD family protein [Microthrixaceae bacterium]